MSAQEDSKSNITYSDDIVMDLASEHDGSDIAEKQLIEKYIDKAFNYVKDDNTAVVLMEKNLNPNITP